MKLAIASDDNVHVTQHFGRTRGFVIVSLEGENEERSYVENRHTQHQIGAASGQHNHDSQHEKSHGHSHTGILAALEGCSVVVAGGMGRRLRDDLDRAGIRGVITDQPTVDAVVTAYRSGILEDHAGRSCSH